MEKGTVEEVVPLDSKSEDDYIEIVSETITNYCNCPTPVEVSPELQEKLRLSLEKHTDIPGKIKAIKVFAIKKNKNSMSRIKDSFSSANGKLSHVANVGILDGIFSNQVQIVTNNNSGNKRKHVQSLAINSEQSKTAKCLPQPIISSDEPIVEPEERPSTPSSPVILYSPIQKGKQYHKINQSLQNKVPSNSNQTPNKNGKSPTFSKDSNSDTHPFENSSEPPFENSSEHPFENSSEPPFKNSSEPPFEKNIHLENNVSILPQNSNDKDSSDQYFQLSQCFGKEREYLQDISKKEINENSSRSQKIPEPLSFDPLLLDERDDGVADFENIFVNIRGKSNPVKLSPITFSSDEEEFELESSILEICSSPKSTFEESLENFPRYKIEEESPIEKADEFYSIDDMLNDIDLDDSYVELKGKADSNFKVEKEFINESENKLLDAEPEKPNQNIKNVKQQTQCKQFSSTEKETKALDSNGNFHISKFLRVDIEPLPKMMLKKEGIPPPWTKIFPLSPPSLPPPGWMSSDNLWQLDAMEFGQVTGLCGLERAAEIRRQVNIPKPRVLRCRRQYIKIGK